MGYINNFGDYVSDYLVTLINNRGTIIEVTITAKCDYMATETAERLYKPLYRSLKCERLD